jgi:SET domain-containing protein
LDIREHQPKLVAKRDIVVGEEIVVDYNETEVGGVEVPCNCGSDKCRGFFLRIE